MKEKELEAMNYGIDCAVERKDKRRVRSNDRMQE
jgi:hypothetical protein